MSTHYGTATHTRPDPVTSALVVGSGPNGLAGAITLARAGVEVTVVEASDSIGGGLRSGELTLPGLIHDHCAAIVPTAVSSPFMQSLNLESHGVEWAWADIDLAHPLDDGSAAVMCRSLERTKDALGQDGDRWQQIFGPLSRNYDLLAEDLLSPIVKVPRHPLRLGLFGAPAMVPAEVFIRIFRTPQARALFAGNAAHAWTPLSRPPSSAVALMFGAVGHRYGWPAVRGGTGQLAAGLARILGSYGGRLEIGVSVAAPRDIAGFDIVLFDTNPALPVRLLAERVPARIRRSLGRYRYGSAAFKVDFAVEGGVPWINADARLAGTVHVCGSADDVAIAERETFNNRMPQRPFVIVGQQAVMDPGRARGDLMPIYSYAHVPYGYTGDASGAIIAQIERFAPGFRDRITAMSTFRPADLERANPNNVGGDMNGGAMDLMNFFARPRLSPDPYWLGVDGHFLCSSSTPPGGGVHGMGGHLAARSALRRMGIIPKGRA